MNRDDVNLSKTLAFILRHNPHLFELELDDNGWVELSALLDAIRHEKKRFKDVQQSDIERIIEQSEKKRYEIEGERIRATYGHSFETKLQYKAQEPPLILYHGTARQALPLIIEAGLQPMSRQYVHLSSDIETAQQVGRRKGTDVVILTIAALQAFQDGIAFYYGNDTVWLADHVPPAYIRPA